MTICKNQSSNREDTQAWGTNREVRAAGGANAGDDAVLIDRIQAHDAQALAEIFDRYGRLVYTVILRLVHDPSIAEDLVQETYLRVWNRIRGFDASKGSISPWL